MNGESMVSVTTENTLSGLRKARVLGTGTAAERDDSRAEEEGGFCRRPDWQSCSQVTQRVKNSMELAI